MRSQLMPQSTLPPWRLRPVNGTCRWISRRFGVLRINTILYTVLRVGGGYRLVNWSSGKVYDSDGGGCSCTCLAFVWVHWPIQAGGDCRCKHIAALRTLGVLPEPHDPPRPARLQDSVLDVVDTPVIVLKKA